MHLTSLLLLLATLSFASANDWETLPSMPTATYRGCAHQFGDKVLVVFQNPNPVHVFDVPSETWVTEVPAPTIRTQMVMVTVSNAVFLAGGGSPPQAATEVYLGTGVWETRKAMPIGIQQAGACSDGVSLVWHAGGYLTSTSGNIANHYRYDYYADTWTVKASLPAANRDHHMMHSVDANTNFLAGGTPSLFYKYDVAADGWDTFTPSPTTLTFVQDAGVALGAHFLLLDGASGLWAYNTVTDVWTTLVSAPKNHMHGGFALIAPFHLYAFGDEAGGTYVHRSNLLQDFSASIQGDPVIRTFSGVAMHLELLPGVFNLFNTAAFTVNIMVDHVVTLPPEEDMVITAVAAAVNDTMHMTYCDAMSSECSVYSDTPDASLSSVPLPTGVRITHGSLVVEVHMRNVTVVSLYAGHEEHLPPSQYYDVFVFRQGGESDRMSGLLGDADIIGLQGLRERLSTGHYTIPSGCLMSLVGPCEALDAPVFSSRV